MALGVSGIGLIGDAYAQNTRILDQYNELIDAGRLAVVRGTRLSADDLLRRELIQGIMCQGQIDIPALERKHGIRFAEYFAKELPKLDPLAEDGLLTLSPDAIAVTARGRLFLRNIAMVFDAYLTPADPQRYSRAI